MTQKQIFDEQATAQLELEQYINQQALLIAVDNGANYSINCQTKDFLSIDTSLFDSSHIVAYSVRLLGFYT